MKASLKFQDDPKPPKLTLKVPLNILNFPFQSTISTAGDTKDLSLNLTTLFQSGPSFKLVYKPNDSWNPFSLVVKTGIGSFGSPNSAPLSMSAEFNLLSRGNPSFLLKVSPQFGDFCLKKSLQSNLLVSGKETETRRFDCNAVNEVVNGVELKAKTVLPFKDRAVLKFNWGVRFPDGLNCDVMNGGGLPDELKSDVINNGRVGFRKTTAGIDFKKIVPFLVMKKISVEHVASGDRNKKKREDADVANEAEESCFDVKRQLDVLHAENGYLRRAVEEIRSEIGTGKRDFGKYMAAEGEKKALMPAFDGFAGKEVDGNVNEGVKKNLFG